MSRVYLEYQGDSIELPVGETTIGRDVTCSLRFNDPSVSRRHLRFVRRHDTVFVQDLGSTNGSTLNGRALTGPIMVEDGDEIALGNRRVKLHFGEGEKPEDTLSLRDFSPHKEMEKLRAATTRIAVTVPPPVAAAAETVAHRRHERTRHALQIVYVSEELEIEATTRDLSMSGVFVCTQVLDPVGTRCELAILIDGGPPLRLRAVVRRVVEHDPAGGEPVGMGVEFESVAGAEKTWLEKTIAKLSENAA